MNLYVQMIVYDTNASKPIKELLKEAGYVIYDYDGELTDVETLSEVND